MVDEIVSLGASALGLSLPEDAAGKWTRFSRLLMERNRQFNLTAIRDEEEAARLHFLDCLKLLTVCGFKGAEVIDVGTGAGFPAVPIAIGEPASHVTAIDSTEKRIAFLKEAAEELKLPLRAVVGRAEELGRDQNWRGQYDIAVSRAVARLNVLAELCLPFVKVGGCFLSMKAEDSDDELSEAGNAIKTLGGTLEQVIAYEIPGTQVVRRVAVIRKTAPTPEKYPRRFARIQKNPL